MQIPTSVELKKQLHCLLEQQALKKGKFILSSGKESTYYLDGRIITLTPEGAYLIGSIMLDMVKDLRIDAFGGPTLGADPIVGAVAALSHMRHIPFTTFIVRKAAKEHGMSKQVEGPVLKAGSRVVIVDDVATTGKALIEAKDALDKCGVTIVKAIVIVDRLEGAQENLAKVNVPLESIFTIREFGL